MFRQGTHLGRCSLRLRRHQQGAPKKVKSQWYGPGMKWIFMHVSCRDLLWSGWILYANSWCFSHSNRETGKVLFQLANPCFWPPWWRLASWRRRGRPPRCFFLPVLEKWRCIFLKTDAQVVLPQAPLLPRWLERFDGLYFSEIWVGQLTTWESAYLMDPLLLTATLVSSLSTPTSTPTCSSGSSLQQWV